MPEGKDGAIGFCSSYMRSAQEQVYYEPDSKPVPKYPFAAGQLPPSVIVSDGVDVVETPGPQGSVSSGGR